MLINFTLRQNRTNHALSESTKIICLGIKFHFIQCNACNQNRVRVVQPFSERAVFLVDFLRIGSYRLPTHRRGAHRIFFNHPFLFFDKASHLGNVNYSEDIELDFF